MAFDGVTCQGEVLRIRRPHDYNPASAKALGPSEPSPYINLALLSVLGGLVDEASAPRISVSGLPTALEEEQVRSILGTFGVLKAFTMLRDAAGKPSGTALAEFADPGVINAAVAGLSVMVIAGQQLHAARAANPESALALQQLIAQQQTALMQRLSGKQAVVPHAAVAAVANSIAAFSAATANLAASAALQQQQAAAASAAPAENGTEIGQTTTAAAASGAAGGSSPGLARTSSVGAAVAAVAARNGCVVRLAAMVERDELLDEEEYDDIVEDTRTEVAKYGPLKQVVIPRPSKDGPAADPPGVGLVFLQYEDTKSADKARLALNGRMFGERPVEASIFDQAKFDAQQYE